MNSEDRIIEDFFQNMKEQDKRVAIPQVPTQAHIKKQNWFPYSVAASFLLIAVSYVILQQPYKVTDYTLHISLKNNIITTTEALMDTDISIEEWESPTQSLIEDF